MSEVPAESYQNGPSIYQGFILPVRLIFHEFHTTSMLWLKLHKIFIYLKFQNNVSF